MKYLRRLAVAAATLIASISVAHAQTPGAMQQQRDRMATMDRDRVANDLTGANSQVLDRRGRKLSSGQVLSAAKTAAAASGLPCQVTEAALLGVTTDRNDLFEIACQSGPGYLVTSPGKSNPVDCLLLADEAERAKAAGQQVPPNATCALKGNKNTVAVFADYARAAGVPCTVDAGALLNPDAYEIGCANADGYIIEHANGGAWTKAPCWRMAASQDGSCRLSTAEESNSAWTDILSGTDAASCAVEKSRQIGIDTQKLVIYEVKCAANSGYLARVNASGKAEKIHPCSDPATAGVGGGCILTKP